MKLYKILFDPSSIGPSVCALVRLSAGLSEAVLKRQRCKPGERVLWMSKEPYDKCNNTILNYKRTRALGAVSSKYVLLLLYLLLFVFSIRFTRWVKEVAKNYIVRCKGTAKQASKPFFDGFHVIRFLNLFWTKDILIFNTKLHCKMQRDSKASQ